MTPTCITEIATLVVAIATTGAAIAAGVYAFITYRLLSEQRKSRLDDKFPCVIVRGRFGPRVASVMTTGNEWTIRLVNIGRGPAFIDHFETTGLPGYPDGVHTSDIDKVIGPDVGDPDLQVAFAVGHPSVLRQPGVAIVIHYRDIARRLFKSRLIAGKLDYEFPW
jgi:hypothetical protein